MATTEMDYENANGNQFDDEAPRYDRRSASPRRDDEAEPARRRSASPNGNDRAPPKDDHPSKDDEGAVNPGSNLFVTGIHPRLSEEEVTRLFEKYGDVEKCQIMKDPHTGESRGFGFVKMVTSDQADAAKDGLQGEVFEGRTLSIEKARRSRPRTPTPGKYFGPPKREGGPPGPGGGGRGGRFDDRRRGGYGGGGYGGRDDHRGYRGSRDDRGYERNYDRGYDRGYERGGDRGGERGGYDRGYREDRGYDRGYREDRGYDRRGGGDRAADRGGDRDDYSRGERYSGGGGGSGGGREDRERYGGARGGREDRGAGYERDRYDRGDRADRPRDGQAPSSYGGGESGARGGDAYGAR